VADERIAGDPEERLEVTGKLLGAFLVLAIGSRTSPRENTMACREIPQQLPLDRRVTILAVDHAHLREVVDAVLVAEAY